MRRRLTPFMLVTLALAVNTCGSPPNPTPAPTLALADVPARMAEVVCHQSFACCTTAEVMQRYMGLGITDEASCVTVASGLIQAFLIPQVQAGITAGRVVYHGDFAAACMNLYAALSCVEFSHVGSDMPAACQNPFEGLGQVGDPCHAEVECTATNYCVGGTAAMDGMCAARPVLGQPCPDFTCATGLYCDNTPATPVCAAPLADGQACMTGDECQSDSCSTGMCVPMCDGL